MLGSDVLRNRVLEGGAAWGLSVLSKLEDVQTRHICAVAFCNIATYKEGREYLMRPGTLKPVLELARAASTLEGKRTMAKVLFNMVQDVPSHSALVKLEIIPIFREIIGDMSDHVLNPNTTIRRGVKSFVRSALLGHCAASLLALACSSDAELRKAVDNEACAEVIAHDDPRAKRVAQHAAQAATKLGFVPPNLMSVIEQEQWRKRGHTHQLKRAAAPPLPAANLDLRPSEEEAPVLRPDKGMIVGEPWTTVEVVETVQGAGLDNVNDALRPRLVEAEDLEPLGGGFVGDVTDGMDARAAIAPSAAHNGAGGTLAQRSTSVLKRRISAFEPAPSVLSKGATPEKRVDAQAQAAQAMKGQAQARLHSHFEETRLFFPKMRAPHEDDSCTPWIAGHTGAAALVATEQQRFTAEQTVAAARALGAFPLRFCRTFGASSHSGDVGGSGDSDNILSQPKASRRSSKLREATTTPRVKLRRQQSAHLRESSSLKRAVSMTPGARRQSAAAAAAASQENSEQDAAELVEDGDLSFI
eukprot:g3093.t1